MQDCIFCKIVAGEIPAAKVWEDDDVFVFMDANPLTEGHALVIPKRHFENIFDIEETVLQKIIVVAKKVSIAVRESLRSDGIRLAQSNGIVAGQVVFHFHLHIIPRYEGDGLGTKMFGSGAQRQDISLEELKTIAQKINGRFAN